VPHEFLVIPQCSKCHTATVELEAGWRCYVVPAHNGHEEEQVALCPDCARREQQD